MVDEKSVIWSTVPPTVNLNIGICMYVRVLGVRMHEYTSTCRNVCVYVSVCVCGCQAGFFRCVCMDIGGRGYMCMWIGKRACKRGQGCVRIRCQSLIEHYQKQNLVKIVRIIISYVVVMTEAYDNPTNQ